MTPARFTPPSGSRFWVGTDEDGDKSVFAIWVPTEPGYFELVGPDGKKGRVPLGAVCSKVSEAEFWSAVAEDEASRMGNRAGSVSDAETKERFERARPMPRSDGGGVNP